MLSTSCLAFGDRRADAARRAGALVRSMRPSSIRKAVSTCADVVVQLTRQVLPLFFLRGDQPLRELAHLALRLFGDRPLLVGPPLEHAQPEDDRQRHREAEQNDSARATDGDRRGTRHAAA